MSAGCMVLLLCSNLALGGFVGIDRTEPRDDSWQEELVAPEPGWSKSKNGFSAMLLLSDEPDDVLQTWETPNAAVPVRTADTIARGVPIVAFVFFAGCEADDNGLCNASADFTIRRPDGSEYESFSDRDLWKQKPAPPEGMLRLSAEYVGVVIEPGDPLGEYEIQVSVHDLNAGTTLDLTHAFTATDDSR
jgi:hypothetical protein